ncbi:hypothetical protein LCGC14_3147780 [marine sediment metagenome]|uniref:DUF559 domain-containing protein n=1 Tax=marine sediment metagenome TaxID=412755 RepID=A0A0F8YJA2_9ZZZZ
MRGGWNRGLSKETSPILAEQGRKSSITKTGKVQLPETKILISKKIKAQWDNYTPEEKDKRCAPISERLKQFYKLHPEAKYIFRYIRTPKTIELQRQKRILYWETTPLHILQENIRKMRGGASLRPNKAETTLGDLLETVCQEEYTYTGDFSFRIGRCCPDFTNIKGQKKVIELFGDYWHMGDNPQDKIDYYKQFGYDCLIIWECGMRDKELSINKIRTFNNVNT